MSNSNNETHSLFSFSNSTLYSFKCFQSPFVHPHYVFYWFYWVCPTNNTTKIPHSLHYLSSQQYSHQWHHLTPTTPSATGYPITSNWGRQGQHHRLPECGGGPWLCTSRLHSQWAWWSTLLSHPHPKPPLQEWDHESRSILAKYIQYNADYTYVTGTAGRGYSKHTIPAYIGRQTRFYIPMTPARWQEFRCGAPQEFLINEALADMADPHIIGEVNCLRGKMELKDTLDKLHKEAQHRLDEIMKEYLIIEQDLVTTKYRIEHANLHSLVQDQLKRSFPAPVQPSPEPTPLIPCTCRLVEMPILMDGHLRQVKCSCCRKRGHKAQECKSRKPRECPLRGDRKHKKAGCPYHRPTKVEVKVQEETHVEIKEVGKMTLLDWIVLLNHPQWTPPVCPKCGEQQPGHGEMECPSYEYCTWCRQHGSYRFISRHQCQIIDQDDPMSSGWDDHDVDLWADNN